MAKHVLKSFAILAVAVTNLATVVSAATIDATSAEQLTAALAKATPGTTVQLAPGLRLHADRSQPECALRGRR